MRLYLSSFRLGSHADTLIDIAGRGARALVVANAIDHYTPVERHQGVAAEIAALAALGFTASELDLRRYWGDAPGVKACLDGCDLVWARGGNPFLLLRALIGTGCDALIREGLLADSFVYGGYSAGVSVLSPTLRGIELIDDPDVLPKEYAGREPPPWDGLGIIPYAVAPHYRSDHPESPLIEQIVHYYIEHHILFRALRDGQVIVVRGDEELVLT